MLEHTSAVNMSWAALNIETFRGEIHSFSGAHFATVNTNLKLHVARHEVGQLYKFYTFHRSICPALR